MTVLLGRQSFKTCGCGAISPRGCFLCLPSGLVSVLLSLLLAVVLSLLLIIWRGPSDLLAYRLLLSPLVTLLSTLSIVVDIFLVNDSVFCGSASCLRLLGRGDLVHDCRWVTFIFSVDLLLLGLAKHTGR